MTSCNAESGLRRVRIAWNIKIANKQTKLTWAVLSNDDGLGMRMIMMNTKTLIIIIKTTTATAAAATTTTTTTTTNNNNNNNNNNNKALFSNQS